MFNSIINSFLVNSVYKALAEEVVCIKNALIDKSPKLTNIPGDQCDSRLLGIYNKIEPGKYYNVSNLEEIVAEEFNPAPSQVKYTIPICKTKLPPGEEAIIVPMISLTTLKLEESIIVIYKDTSNPVLVDRIQFYSREN